MSANPIKINAPGMASDTLRRILANKKFFVKDDNTVAENNVVEPVKIEDNNEDNNKIVKNSLQQNAIIFEDKNVQTDNILFINADNNDQLYNKDNFKKEIIKYEFDDEKIRLLEEANNKLKINESVTNERNKIVFVYCLPKVGSTALVSSIRLFASDKFIVVHVHNETMLSVLYKIEGVTINEIIHYNGTLGREVYVIDIYRVPIERKMSLFFENLSSFHFNTTDNNILSYKMSLITERFNQLYNNITNSNHFLDVYNIELPERFDSNNKYLSLDNNGVKYIVLRLHDSKHWDSILTSILGVKIKIIKDYQTCKKEIGELYNKFKEEYKVPLNYYHQLSQCKYLRYFLSEAEIEEYNNYWKVRTTEDYRGFTKDEYKLYTLVSNQNCTIVNVDLEHYIDEGCFCKHCFIKRDDATRDIALGKDISNKIIHDNNLPRIEDNVVDEPLPPSPPQLKFVANNNDNIKLLQKLHEIRMKKMNRMRRELGVGLYKLSR